MSAAFDTAAFIATGIAGILWLISSLAISLPKIAPGLEGLDHVAKLSDQLSKQGRANSIAAGITAIALLLEFASRMTAA